MSQINVDTIKKADGTGALSVPAESGTVVTTASPSLGRRNLIINGAMQVAQRGTSSTANGWGSVDRFQTQYGGGTITHSQESLSSGDPYDAGFRNYLRATVTTAGSSAATDYTYLMHRIEAQDMASSGWNYTSSSSYITFQFWVRSSVAGTYYCTLRTFDGTNQLYAFPVTLSADTWTKVTKTVSGDANLQFNNDNGTGLQIIIRPFVGSDYSDASCSINAWQTRVATAQTPDYTHSWQQTSGATFDVTGVQLEVGSVATPFEHRSYGEELALCQRYFERFTGANTHAGLYSGTSYIGHLFYKVTKRARPTFSNASGAYTTLFNNSSGDLGGLDNMYFTGAAGNYIIKVDIDAEL